MAWCFGLYGFLDAATTSAERVVSLAQMIAVSGARIEANLDYAISQRNNHGISEGLGLWTIGTLFPEFKNAEQWKETGRRVLEKQGRDLIYDDGAFSQHSVNYHRVMLHSYLWALQRKVSNQLHARIEGGCLQGRRVSLPDSGRAQRASPAEQNDGALILPLNNCDYQDFRPVIQAAQCFGTGHAVTHQARGTRTCCGCLDQMRWTLALTRRACRLRATQGGYYTLRSGRVSLHADVLRFDIGPRKPICFTRTYGGAGRTLLWTPERLATTLPSRRTIRYRVLHITML
jgi:asparagine synthase (glutamine-hydrolysing)